MSPIINEDNKRVEFKCDKPHKKITGTKLAAILGINPYNTPFATWCDIVHAYDFPFEDTVFTIAGKVIEPKQADYVKYNFYPNLVTPTQLFGENYFESTRGNFFNDEHFGGMWDYLDMPEGKVTRVFEMKTASEKKKALWGDDKIPEHYALQASLYAFLLGVDDISMVVTFLPGYVYNNPDKFIVNSTNTIIKSFKLSERYPNFANDYIVPAIEWWHNYVESGISPEYTDKDLELITNMKLKMEDKKVVVEDDKLSKANTDVDELHSNIQPMVNQIVNKYSKDLDAIITKLSKLGTMTNEEIRDTMLALSIESYVFGMSKDSSLLKQECATTLLKESQAVAYNNAEGTQVIRTNQSIMETTDKQVVSLIYNGVANLMKTKLDEAHRVVNVLNSILISRNAEAKMTGLSTSDGRQILNEGVTF